MSETIKELITHVQLGDEASQEKLWECFRPLRLSWASKSTFLGLEFQELLQEAYIIFRESIDQYNPERGLAFESYYKARLYNWRYKQLRKKREYLGVESDILEQDAYHTKSTDEDIADQVYHQICYSKIGEYLSFLSEEDRRLLTLAYFHQLRLKEIGELVGMREGTVATRLTRIKAKLREYLKKDLKSL